MKMAFPKAFKAILEEYRNSMVIQAVQGAVESSFGVHTGFSTQLYHSAQKEADAALKLLTIVQQNFLGMLSYKLKCLLACYLTYSPLAFKFY